MYISQQEFIDIFSREQLFSRHTNSEKAYDLYNSIKKDINADYSTYKEHFFALLNKETFFYSANKTEELINCIFPEVNSYYECKILKKRLLDEVAQSPNFLNQDAFLNFIKCESFDNYEKRQFITDNDDKIKNHHWLHLTKNLLKLIRVNFYIDDIASLKYATKFDFSNLIFDEKNNPYHEVLISHSSDVKVNEKINALKVLRNLNIPFSATCNNDNSCNDDIITVAIKNKVSDKILNSLTGIVPEIQLKSFVSYLKFKSGSYYNDNALKNFYRKTRINKENLMKRDVDNKQNWIHIIDSINRSRKKTHFVLSLSTLLIDYIDELSYKNKEGKIITLRECLGKIDDDNVKVLIVAHDKNLINKSLNQENQTEIKSTITKKRI